MSRKRENIFFIIVLIINIGTFLLVNLSNSFGYYIENGHIVTSSFNGEITVGFDITTDNNTYSNEHDNGNVIVVVDGNVTMNHLTIHKKGDSLNDEDGYNGVNSAIIVADGIYNINGGSIDTNGTYANAIYANSNGTVNIQDLDIFTNNSYSNALFAKEQAKITGERLNIETFGDFSSAIMCLEGTGSIIIDSGNYKTNGSNSPVILASGNVKVSNATLESSKSEGIVLSNNGSVTLNDSNLVSNHTSLFNSDTSYKNISLYQEDNDSDKMITFISNNSNITTNNGDTFYVTNTKANIKLSNNVFSNVNGNFLTIEASHYGESGSNGGNVTLDMSNQNITGNIVVDDSSVLNMSLTNQSLYRGSINKDNLSKNISLKLSSDSSIILTDDIYVNSFVNDDLGNSNVHLNGHNMYVNGEKLVIGSSDNNNVGNNEVIDDTNIENNNTNVNQNNNQENSNNSNNNSNNNQSTIPQDSQQSTVHQDNNQSTVNDTEITNQEKNNQSNGEVIQKEEPNKEIISGDKNNNSSLEMSSDDIDLKKYKGNTSVIVNHNNLVILNIISITLIITSLVFLIKNILLRDKNVDMRKL